MEHRAPFAVQRSHVYNETMHSGMLPHTGDAEYNNGDWKRSAQ
jgi:hypothetical protein